MAVLHFLRMESKGPFRKRVAIGAAIWRNALFCKDQHAPKSLIPESVRYLRHSSVRLGAPQRLQKLRGGRSCGCATRAHPRTLPASGAELPMHDDRSTSARMIGTQSGGPLLL